MATDANGKEWLFFVMKLVLPEPRPEIIDSYDDPLEAAQHADQLNQDKETPGFHFLEARPVIASISCEAEFLSSKS